MPSGIIIIIIIIMMMTIIINVRVDQLRGEDKGKT